MATAVYEDAAAFGKATSLIGSILFSFFGLIAIGLGIFFIMGKPKYTKKITGTITNDITCNKIIELQHKNQGASQTNYNCLNMNIVYTINNKTYENILSVQDSKIYQKNEKIDFYYNPKNPADIRYNSDSTRTMGIIIVSVAVVILLIIWLNYWMTSKYKLYAATQGTATGVNVFRSFTNL